MFTQIRVTLVQGMPENSLKALVTLKVADLIYLTGIRVIEGKNGPFVSMPCIKKNGEYMDVFFPASRAVREEMSDLILTEYKKELALYEPQPLKITHEDFVLNQ